MGGEDEDGKRGGETFITAHTPTCLSKLSATANLNKPFLTPSTITSQVAEHSHVHSQGALL